MDKNELIALAESFAPKFGLPVDLVTSQIAAESGTPGEIGTGNADAVSPAGAVGLMQIEPATALGMLRNDAGLLKTILQVPEVNAMLGMHYDSHECLATADECGLKGVDRFRGMLAAYNAGPGALRKARAAANGDSVSYADLKSHLPSETQKYVDTIIVAWMQADNPQA